MVITRKSEKRLKKLAKTFRAVAVIGPRQSGKTTLCKMVFPKKPYVSLENPTILQFAQTDPIAFLQQYPKGAIIDEAQRMPSLFSYLQQILDETKTTGLFILTGSNNFLMQENISQSLAGRIGYLTLLPFSLSELKTSGSVSKNWFINAYKGFYPEVNVKKIQPLEWYAAYTKTYIERDVRQIMNISNLTLFTKFVQLCAGRASQILNVNSLANDCGIDHKTAQSWLSILESSFIIYFLKPYFKNFNKQISKSPKMYFYDTGLLCYLLGFTKSQELRANLYRGAIFENFIITDKIKAKENEGLQISFYYWRDKTGNEVDLIIERAGKISIAEIKSASTINPAFWKSLLTLEKLTASKLDKYIYYGGDENQQRSGGLNIVGWQNLAD